MIKSTVKSGLVIFTVVSFTWMVLGLSTGVVTVTSAFIRKAIN